MIFWGTFFVTQISQMTQIFFVGVFLSHRFHRFPQIFLWNLFVLSQGDICNDRTGRLREIPCRPMMKKICVICEICVTKKTSQEKSVYICEICGTFYNLRGYLQRPNRSPPRKSVSNRLSRKPPNKFRVIR